ncbi:hypothetical protein [Marinifilum sp.]|uniref:hypothetical protein n=1 Tax=Marinifilum sp. TaxID=2033137 RepID=UPI003BA91D8F
MKTIQKSNFKLLNAFILLVTLTSFSLYTHAQVNEEISGVYSGIVRTQSQRKLTKIELYQGYSPIYKKPAKVTEWVSVFLRITQYDNKKGKGEPSTIVYHGRINQKLIDGYHSLDLKTIQKDKRTGKFRGNTGTKKILLKYLSDGKFEIKNIGLHGEYEKVGDAAQVEGLVRFVCKIRLQESIARNGSLVLGSLSKVNEDVFDPLIKPGQNGISIYIDSSKIDNVLFDKEIHANYKLERNNSARRSQSDISLSYKIIKPALGVSPNGNYGFIPLVSFPNVEKLILHDAKTSEAHFIVSIHKSRSRATLFVKKTTEAIENHDSYITSYKIAKDKAIMAEHEFKMKRKERLRNKEFNPSGVGLDFGFGIEGSYLNKEMWSTIRKVFYGEFELVDKNYFPRFHNTFLWYASKIYGPSYSKENVKEDVHLETIEEYPNGHSEVVQTHHFEIWMQPRFVNNFRSFKDEGDFTLVNVAFAWGEKVNQLLTEYTAESLMFKQLLENVYRYSEGLPPVKTIEELEKVL